MLDEKKIWVGWFFIHAKTSKMLLGVALHSQQPIHFFLPLLQMGKIDHLNLFSLLVRAYNLTLADLSYLSCTSNIIM